MIFNKDLAGGLWNYVGCLYILKAQKLSRNTSNSPFKGIGICVGCGRQTHIHHRQEI